MMPAQHGTLNVVKGGVFMVLSVPISAFDGVDDDHDGKLSMDEFETHRLMISNIVKAKVTLSDEQGKRPLQGMMLSPAVSHNASKSPVTHIVVMGRYQLNKQYNQLTYQLGVFGDKSSEQTFKITAKDKLSNKQKPLKQTAKLTPKSSQFSFFL